MSEPVFHERQRLELCAVHALNNLLQRPEVSQQLAEDICRGLSPDTMINPHRSILGTGNYDVNVIMAALQTLDYAAVWWDKRKSLESLVLNEVFGFILNILSPISLGFLSLPIKRKHWIAVREIDGVYYNLDSKLKSPAKLGGPAELKKRRFIHGCWIEMEAQATVGLSVDMKQGAFLHDCISRGSCEILLVVSKDAEDARLWLSDEARAT